MGRGRTPNAECRMADADVSAIGPANRSATGPACRNESLDRELVRQPSHLVKRPRRCSPQIWIMGVGLTLTCAPQFHVRQRPWRFPCHDLPGRRRGWDISTVAGVFLMVVGRGRTATTRCGFGSRLRVRSHIVRTMSGTARVGRDVWVERDNGGIRARNGWHNMPSGFHVKQVSCVVRCFRNSDRRPERSVRACFARSPSNHFPQRDEINSAGLRINSFRQVKSLKRYCD